MQVIREEMKEKLLEIDVEVSVDEVEEAYQTAYTSIAKEIAIPGFRKGKAPRRLVEARVGRDFLKDEVAKIMIPKVYEWAVKELNLEVIREPEINGEFHSGEVAVVTIKAEVIPGIEIGPYVNLQVEIEKEELTEEDIDKEVMRQLRVLARLETLDRDIVEKGDYVTIDYEGFLEGNPFPDSSRKDLSFEIGVKEYLDSFEEGCLGLKKGEESVITVNYPDTFLEENLAGQTIDYKVIVKDIQRIVLPEINDANVKKLRIAGVLTLQDLKDAIKERYELKIKENQKQIFERRILDKIAASSVMQIPEHLIEDEAKKMAIESMSGDKPKGEKDEPFDAKKIEKLTASYLPLAKDGISHRLILNAIIQKEGFTVETDELEKKMEQLARLQNMDRKAYRRKILKEGNFDELKLIVLREKALTFLHENNFVIHLSKKEENED